MKFIRWSLKSVETVLVLAGLLFLLMKAGGMTLYVVLSGSMNPTIETGSIVVVDTKEKDYMIGDIITFQIEEQLVTHRIVEMEQGIIKTKGDANAMPDSKLITKYQIKGKVKHVIPKWGYILFYFQSKKIIALIGGAVILSNLFDILSEYQIQNKRNKKKGTFLEKYKVNL